MIGKFMKALFFLCILGVFPIRAQVSTSSITGVVTDTSGAVVANAKVEAKNDDTGVVFNQNTTSAGTYAFPSLTPGRYSITVTMPGFQTFSSTHNVLTVGTPLVVDVMLKVGTVGQTVEVVESNYLRLETSNATVSDIMDTKQVQNLPLNGRNPLALLTLQPGVVQRTTNSAGSGTHVFGSRDRAHNVTIDGIDANESTVPNPQGNIQRLNPDNVEEFRTVTLGATAEDGRNSGANVIVATRAGTNAYHGTVFYFNRNTDYNANEWFSNYEGKSRPELKLHQYGFDVGGPIVKNKTFFFGSFQNNQINQTEPVSATKVGVLGAPAVYTSLARNGMFRYLRGCINFVNPSCPKGDPNNITGNSPLLVDANGNRKPGVPLCSTTVTRDCVDSYNIFDKANDPQGIGGDQAVLDLMKRLPAANAFNLGDGLNQAGFNWNPPSQFRGPHYYVRVDHTFGPSDSVFVRWLQNTFDTKHGDFLNSRPAVYPGFPPLGEVNRLGKNLAISYRHNFSPTLVNELTAGYNRFRFQFTFGESNPDFPNPQKVPLWADDCVLGSMLNVDPPYCLSPHTQRAITTPQIVDNLTWVRGRHTLRAGLNFRFYIHNDSRGFFGGSVVQPIIRFNQNNRQGNFANIPATGDGTTCHTCANSADINVLQQAIDELAGIPSRIQQAFLANFNNDTYASTNFATVYTRAHQYDSYVQDAWKLRPNLTLNLGVRWEYNPAPYDAKQTLVPNVLPDGSQGNVAYVKAGRWFKNDNIGAVGPRIGIAWSPDSKTSLRAGYGWLFDTLSTFQVTAIAGKVPGFLQNCLINIPTPDQTTGVQGPATATNGCVVPPALVANAGARISTGFPVTVPTPTIKPSAALSPIAQTGLQAPSVGGFDRNIKNPSVHEWDLTIQRELPNHFVAEIGYVGKRGTHLYRAYDLNQVSINAAGFLDSFNIAMMNRQLKCNPDGTGCPTGVTGQTPTLLLAMMSAARLNGRTLDFDTYNIGNFANFADGLAGANAITNRAMPGGTCTTTDRSGCFPANYFRPNPQFGQIFFQDSGGDSYYHGLFVAVRRRFEQGLDLAFSYTFSKSIDDMSVDPTGAATGGALSSTNSRTPTDIHNFRLDRALSDFNNTHVLLANLLYEFPIGKGKRLASSAPNWANQIIGGWSFTGIFDYQSGEPYSITSGSLTANGAHVSFAQVRGPLDKGHIQFVNGVEGPVMYNATKRITNVADPNFNCVNVIGTQTYFCIPLPGQQGNGRNLFRGPNFWNLDSACSRSSR